MHPPISRWASGLFLTALVLSGCGWHGIYIGSPTGSGAVNGAAPKPEQTEAVAATPSPSPGRPTAPPSNVIQWQTNPIKRTSTGARVFSGTVTNSDQHWTIVNVQFELKLLDGDGNLVKTIVSKVQDLNPGDRGDYTIAVPSDVQFELSNLRLTWDWIAPAA
ncbi:MAG TPA: FxLYD domain-containing protein [Candidatus Limnocylindria bacterium]